MFNICIQLYNLSGLSSIINTKLIINNYYVNILLISLGSCDKYKIVFRYNCIIITIVISYLLGILLLGVFLGLWSKRINPTFNQF